MTTAEDRATGALVGLAAGDAVGTTLEFERPGTFEPLTDMVGGGPFDLRAGAWTDDTSMALCLAESILDTGDLDPSDQLRRYLLWRDEGYLSSTGHCFDIGHTVSTQLARFRRTGQPVDLRPDEEAAANGSLMRLAPVPIRWHTDPAVAAERAGESSRPTHAAARPVDACRVLGAMVSALIAGTPADDVLAPDFWRWGELHPAIEAVARGSWREKAPPAIRGTGYCVDALEAALWAVGGASDFRDAVLRAANLGDDADTTAAIAGQLAGARWGASGIPASWLAKVTAADRIESLALGLFRAGGGAVTSPAWRHDDFIHAWWVEPGRLLAGEYPGHPDPARARSKVDVLVDAGVRTFVDLTTPEDPLDPYARHVERAAAARDLTLEHVRFPIPDRDVVDDSRYAEVVDILAEARRSGVAYVHCWGGVGRTGTVIGSVLASAGAGYDEILDRLDAMRTGTRKSHRACPENELQRAVLERLSAAAGSAGGGA